LTSGSIAGRLGHNDNGMVGGTAGNQWSSSQRRTTREWAGRRMADRRQKWNRHAELEEDGAWRVLGSAEKERTWHGVAVRTRKKENDHVGGSRRARAWLKGNGMGGGGWGSSQA
jgi:hypothetical protein